MDRRAVSCDSVNALHLARERAACFGRSADSDHERVLSTGELLDLLGIGTNAARERT